MEFPTEWAESLRRDPKVGDRDDVMFLVSASLSGEPMVCLLSSRQVAAEGQTLRLLIRSMRTIHNLRDSHRAVLHVIANGVAWMFTLEVVKMAEPSSNGFAVEVSLTKVEEDRRSADLCAANYLVTEELLTLEGASIHR